MKENQITSKIIGCAIEVHKTLGPGLLESVYQECLKFELENAGLEVSKEVALPVVYKEIKLDTGYRIDLLVEDKVVVEIKSIECINEVHSAQILSYMKLGNYSLGLILNFNVLQLTKGIRRMINTQKSSYAE